MLPYWLLLGVFSTGAVLFEGQRQSARQIRFFLIVAALGAALMIGLRYKVGADWEPYRLIFWDMRFTSLEAAIVRSDPAFGLLNWLVRRAGMEIWVVNTACAAIFMVGLYRFAQQQPSPWLTFAIAVPYLLIVVAMGYTRQATAIGLILLALCAIRDRLFMRFLVYMLLAATFHRSAVLLLPIVAMSYSRNRFLTTILAMIATGAGYVFILAPEAGTYIDRYSGAEQGAIESDGTFVRIAMNVLAALILLLLRFRFPSASDDYFKIWRNFALLALIALSAFAYFGNNTAVDRLSIYLIPLQLYVFGNLPATFGTLASPSRVATIVVIAYATAIQFVWLVMASNSKFWIPFRLYPL